MRSIVGGAKLRDVARSNAFFVMLAAALMTVVLLWASPARAQPAPDLSITKESRPAQVEPGQNFKYVLTVTNAADAAPSGPVTVTDDLPESVTLKGAPIACMRPVDPGGTVTCPIENLEAGESQTLTLTVTTNEPGVIRNRATATADGFPAISDTDSATTRVVPDLVIRKLDDPDPVRTEGLLLYTLRVQNQSTVEVDGIGVTDDLPLDVVDFVAVQSRKFDCQYTAGAVQCINGELGPGEIGTVEIVVEPEVAGTISNRADVFVSAFDAPIDTGRATTTVTGSGGSGDGGGGDGGDGDGGDGDGGDGDGDSGDGDDTNTGNDLPQGEQCSPVVNLDTEEPIGVISGTENSSLTFTNTFNEPLPLRIVYATSSEDGSLGITVTPQDGGEAILDETIDGKKRGVLQVETEVGATYDVEILPEDQGFAVQFEIDRGAEACTDPETLDPDVASSSNDPQDDVIDSSIPDDDDLPETGGVPISVLAGCAALLLAGTAVVVAAVRRKP